MGAAAEFAPSHFAHITLPGVIYTDYDSCSDLLLHFLTVNFLFSLTSWEATVTSTRW